MKLLLPILVFLKLQGAADAFALDTIGTHARTAICISYKPATSLVYPVPASYRTFGKDFQSSTRSTTFSLHSSEANKIIDNTQKNRFTLDKVLISVTNAFPFFVLGSAILGVIAPSALTWVNNGNIISLMLAAVMMGTGMTLEKRDFQKVGEEIISVPAGVLCQFGIMPLAAFFVGRSMLLHAHPIHGPSLCLGLILVGCAPGGTASNLVSLIAGANVALSVVLTACSTILASAVTPLLVKVLVGSTVQIQGWALFEATAKVVLAPVILGMLLNAKVPKVCKILSRFTPCSSVLLVSLICGGVVSQNAVTLSSSSAMLLPVVVGSVLLLHSIGFLAGYLIPKKMLRFSEQTSRTISIETGMQNSALAVVLARSLGAPALASLPGALSATVHSCLGSLLAAYWRLHQVSSTGETEVDV